ncbi:MAG TPA: 3-mercaptopyruvate sulfurtransferase [Gemmatimonadales bacterium]|nr:3-mercaptopyruvate sulfurtransferase [Gemmatimonadales bacterium]
MLERSLVTTEWLAAHLGRPDVRVVDGSWYLPNSGRNAAAEFAAGHIPGAVFFDLDASSDPASPLPHMLPAAEAFAGRMGALGLDDRSTIVVYDGSGVNLSAPRVWWSLRVFGHAAVAVLDGGLAKWRAEGRTLEAGVPIPARADFTARLDPARVRDLAQVRANVATRREQLVDMRPAPRFEGAAPDPRPGVRPGHIPSSRNLPYTELASVDGTVLAPAALRARIGAAGVDLSRPIIASCGSATSACSFVLALHLLGHDQVAVYDGSWAEWGGRADTPIALGPPGKEPP